MLTARHSRCRGRGSDVAGTVPPVGAALAPVRWLVLASGADPMLGGEPDSTDNLGRCEVSMARSGPQLLRLAQQCRPDVAVLAGAVTDRDLIGLGAQLRQRHPELPIVICSAQASTEDVVAGLTAGADLYLRTPISTAELTARVEAILRRTQRGRPAALHARSTSTTRVSAGR